MILISDLNQYDRKTVSTNGCSPASFPFSINLIFECDCNLHDLQYWQGGSEEDRKTSDKEFLRNMLNSIKESNLGIIKKLALKTVAYKYYWLVKKLGKKYFEYRTKKLDSKYYLPSFLKHADYRFINGEYKHIPIIRVTTESKEKKRWFLKSELGL